MNLWPKVIKDLIQDELSCYSIESMLYSPKALEVNLALKEDSGHHVEGDMRDEVDNL